MKRIFVLLSLTAFYMSVYANIFDNSQYQKKFSYTFIMKDDADEEITGLSIKNTENRVVYKEYEVQETDNIYKITKKTGQNITVILFNNPDLEIDTVSKKGNKINIYGDNFILYTRKNNEDLSDIAEKFGTDTDSLNKLNSGKAEKDYFYVKADENKLKYYMAKKSD